MKNLCLWTVLLAMITCPCSAQETKRDEPASPEFKSVNDKVSYAIGMNIGRNLKQQGLDVNPALIAAGIAAILNNTKSALTDEEIQAAFAEYQAEQQKLAAAKAAANKEAAAKFLGENETKEGVKKTASGLQYMILTEGTGEKPTSTSTVSTHYRGKLLNGDVFDQSYEGSMPTDADQPVSFGVTQVIKGWTEALQLMKVGSTYRLFIHPDLAYGENGPPSIGPNSLLIFDIHLVGVKN